MSKLYSLISVLAQSFSGFVLLIICSRILDIETFGLLSYLLLIGGLLAIVSDFGLSTGFQVELKNNSESGIGYLKLTLYVRLLFAICAFIIGLLLIPLLNNFKVDVLLSGYFAFLSFHLNNMLVQLTTYFRFYGNFKRDVIWNLSNAGLTVIFASSASLYFGQLLEITIALVLAKICLIAVYLAYNIEMFKAPVFWSRFSWRIFSGYCVVNLVGYLYLNIDGILSGLYLDPVDLAYYRSAISLVMAFSLGTNVLSQYLLPIWNVKSQNLSEIYKLYVHTTKIIFCLLVLYSILLIAFFEFSVKLIFGFNLDLDSVSKLSIVGVIMLRYLSWPSSTVLLIYGKNRARLLALTIACLITFIISFLGFELQGISGGFLGLFFGHISLFFIYLYLVRNLFEKQADQLRIRVDE